MLLLSLKQLGLEVHRYHIVAAALARLPVEGELLMRATSSSASKTLFLSQVISFKATAHNKCVQKQWWVPMLQLGVAVEVTIGNLFGDGAEQRVRFARASLLGRECRSGR
jgi:hypothetical protein